MRPSSFDAITSSSTPVHMLAEVAFWRERRLDEPRRVQAYRKAADALAELSPDDWIELDRAGAWRTLPGVGQSTAAVIEAAMAGRVPEVLRELRTDGREPVAHSSVSARLVGDLHSHTTWSDGGSSLLEMMTTAALLGREYQAVTDHSPSLRVARGLTADRLRAQWDEIAQVQAQVVAAGHQLRVLKGIEVDILTDGTLDQDEQVLAGLDVVVASVHSKLDMEPDAMTRRMVTAVSNRHVTVLGHCTGRKVIASKPRKPSQFDAEVVFEACRQFGVAVEINSRPERCDPPDDLLALAAEMGCLFSIDTDAHAPGQLDFLDYGAARAEAAGIDPDRIITTWPVERLLEFAAR